MPIVCFISSSIHEVNKWSIYELWDWMREHGEDPEPFWDGVKDITIKTVLCGHKDISSKIRQSVGSFYNSYTLLGVDILMDNDSK